MQGQIFKEIVVRKSFKLCQLRNPDVSDNKSASKQVLERSKQQNCFRGFQEVCKDEIFEYIVGRNHLNFVNHKILMFLMIKVPMYVIAIDIYYFKNKYFLILLKSCITTLDKKEPRGTL